MGWLSRAPKGRILAHQRCSSTAQPTATPWELASPIYTKPCKGALNTPLRRTARRSADLVRFRGMLAKVFSAAVHGLEGLEVEIEVNSASGMTAIIIVGLPDTAVRESRDRVTTAVSNSMLQDKELILCERVSLLELSFACVLHGRTTYYSRGSKGPSATS